MKRRLVALVALVIVGGGGAVFYVRWQPAPPTDRIVLSGNVEITEAQSSFKHGGRVEARLVSEGEVVHAGQVIARLDRVEWAQHVLLQQAELRAAAADLAELRAGSRPEEIAQGEAALARARAEEHRWRTEAARQAALYEQDIVSAREQEAAHATLEVARAQVRDAEERLALLRKGPRQERIAQARARLERERQALAMSHTRLDEALLVAPVSGIVLSEHVEPGEYVSPGSPVVTIGALADVWLRAYIDEPDLGRVKVGQRARLTTDTYPGKVYDGVVSFIASEAEFTPKTVQTTKERVKLVYRIKIDVPNPSFELKPGMPADAQILLAEATRASR
jgi:HlyD family secretion protein